VAFDLAAQYAGIEPPSVQVNRDFDLQVLDPQQVTQYMGLWQNGAITHSTLLEMLALGEVLPHIDVEQEIEQVEQEKLLNMDMAVAAGTVAEEELESESTSVGEEESEMRRELTARLREQAAANSEEDN
jgi:hypothetical protein